MNSINPIRYPQRHKATRAPTHKGHTMRAFLLFILLAASTAEACINMEGVSIDGNYVMVPADMDTPIVTHLRESMRGKPSRRVRTLSDSANRSEAEAVRDIFTGNYAAAIVKLQALETATPGNYSTAANLGTAYELAGDNKNALHWITEGMKRNEASHYGTEWLHKKILEAKIAMESDSDYLKKNPILPFAESPNQNRDFTFNYDGRLLHREELLSALRYQLGERMLFVKPTDPVVADLLYSFAILEASTRTLEPAVELLQLAKEYGYHDTADLDARIARYQQIIDGTWKITGKDIVGGFTLIALLSLPLMLVVTIVRAFLRHLRARRLSISS
jgi:hypothetical protein